MTVYCAHDCVGQGVGGRLYKALLDGVRQRGYCNAVALVTGQNKESCAFHKALGFKKIGVESPHGIQVRPMAGPCLLVDGPAPRPGASGAGAPGAIKLHNTKLSGALLIGSARFCYKDL